MPLVLVPQLHSLDSFSPPIYFFSCTCHLRQVLIHDGELIHGVIDKKSVGSGAGALIHLTYV